MVGGYALIALCQHKRYEKKTNRKFKFRGRDPARFDRRKVKCFTCNQMGHFSRECKDRKDDDDVRYSAYQQHQLEGGNSKAMVSLDQPINWKVHEAEDDNGSGADVTTMLASCDTEDQHNQYAFMGISQVHNYVFGCSVKYNELKEAYDELKPKYNDCYVEVQTYKNSLKTLEKQKVWFQKNQLAYEEKIRVLERDLKNATNELKYSEKERAKEDLEKQELHEKLDKEVARHNNWLSQEIN